MGPGKGGALCRPFSLAPSPRFHIGFLLPVSANRVYDINGHVELTAPAPELAEVLPVIPRVFFLRELNVEIASILHRIPLDGSGLLFFHGESVFLCP